MKHLAFRSTPFRLFPSFRKSEEGSALILVGIATTTLVMAAGVAIDMGRVQAVQTRLSNALDAAGLAAASVASGNNLDAVTQKYFHANFPNNYLGSNIAVGSHEPTVSYNANTGILTLDVSGSVPTTFIQVLTLGASQNIAVSAHSQVTRANMGMELVLVLDVTGSMNCRPSEASCSHGEVSDSKIVALRNAATDLMTILYGNNASLPNMWVGIVPFSQTVKIGTGKASWTTSAAITSPTPGWGPAGSTWYGCVEARAANGRDITDDPPSVELFPRYYAPCNKDTGSNDSATNAWYGTNSSIDSNGNPKWGNCATSGGGGFHYSNTALSATFGPNDGCSLPAVVPMTATKSTVTSAITALYAGGATEIPIGMAWGWRMLSPNWLTAGWSAEMTAAQLPFPYHKALMNKVVILMTDGDNDISWDNYTAYGTPNLTTGPLLGANACSTSNHNNCNTGEDELDDRTSAICESMKTQGIIIYTIAFGTGLSDSSKTMLRLCATNDDHYFLSPDSATLSTAFHQIGDSLANLRVSQ